MKKDLQTFFNDFTRQAGALIGVNFGTILKIGAIP